MAKNIKKPGSLETLKECFVKPSRFYGFGKTIDGIVCFDENGASLNYLKVQEFLSQGKEISDHIRFFTLTGCLFDRKDFGNAKTLLRAVKKQYWHEGADDVLFHSRDIRKKEKQFFMSDSAYYRFLGSLSTALDFVTCRVYSITFDLKRYIEEGYTFDPYGVAFDLLTPRILHDLPKGKRIAYVFESRGTKEDQSLLGHARDFLFQRGTKTMSPMVLQKVIRGVFFVEKKTSKDPKNVYPGIEIADLFSHPIHSFARFKTRGQDFEIVEKKLSGYPEYWGKGLLLFPEPWLKERERVK